MSANTTKTIIIRAMLKLVRKKQFSHITVTEICNQSEINRRTFYRYYADKYDLLRAVYIECFFSKLSIGETDDFWDIIRKICEQIYNDKDFFRHAFEVKEQNGFREELRSLLVPLYKREAQPTTPYPEIRTLFINADIDLLFHLIEMWIKDDIKQSTKDFINTIKASFFVSGTWHSQLATGEKRTFFPDDVVFDFEEYLKKNR